MEQQTPPPARKFTARQQRFIELLVKEPNQTKAAIGAGFSPKYAKNGACNLMARPEIAAEVQRRRKEAAEAAKLDAVEILENLAAIARATREDFEVVNGELKLVEGSDPKLWRAVAGLRYDSETGHVIDFRLRDSIRAQALYMKHLGMLRDIVQITTPIPVKIYIPDNKRDTVRG